MKTAGIITLAIGLTLCAQPVFAQNGVTPYASFNYGGDAANCISLTQCEQRQWNWGVSLGAAGGTGFEQDIAYAKNFFGDSATSSNSLLTMMSNLAIGFPAGPVHIFGIGGLGLIRAHASLNLTDQSQSKNEFGYDYGGGVVISMGKHFGVRGDLRWFKTFQDITVLGFSGDKLSFTRASLGVTLR